MGAAGLCCPEAGLGEDPQLLASLASRPCRLVGTEGSGRLGGVRGGEAVQFRGFSSGPSEGSPYCFPLTELVPALVAQIGLQGRNPFAFCSEGAGFEESVVGGGGEELLPYGYRTPILSLGFSLRHSPLFLRKNPRSLQLPS